LRKYTSRTPGHHRATSRTTDSETGSRSSSMCTHCMSRPCEARSRSRSAESFIKSILMSIPFTRAFLNRYHSAPRSESKRSYLKARPSSFVVYYAASLYASDRNAARVRRLQNAESRRVTPFLSPNQLTSTFLDTSSGSARRTAAQFIHLRGNKASSRRFSPTHPPTIVLCWNFYIFVGKILL
jgi:hypothetical protein